MVASSNKDSVPGKQIRKEEALRKSELKFEALFQGMPLPVYTWQRSGEDFVLVDHNAAADAVTGGKIGDFLGITLSGMYLDRPDIVEDISRCFAEKDSFQREMPYRFKSTGEDKTLVVKYAFVPPNLVLVQTEDITERVRAEEALRESERRLNEAQHVAQVASFERDFHTGKGYWSDEQFRLFGYEPGEVPNSHELFRKHVHPDDLAMVTDAIEEGLATGKGFEIDCRFIPRGGEARHAHIICDVGLDVAGKPRWMHGTFQDITERKQAEQDLRASEEQYRDLVEKISDVIYAVDASGVITYVNPAIETLIGLPPEQVVGQPFDQFILPEDLGRAQGNVQDLLSGVVPGTAEYRVLNASGETRWIRVTSQPIVDEGRTTGLQGLLSDITERKRVEEQQKEEAVAAERRRLARELHDSVTQTLYSANLIAETLLSKWEEDPAEGPRGLEHLQRFIQGASAEMRTLLLELDPAALADQELPVLLRQLADATMVRTPAIVTTTVMGECTVPNEVKVALYRIAQEALNNVVKHAGAQRVKVNLQCRRGRPGARPKGAPDARPGAQTILSIKDDGCGFDPEDTQPAGLGTNIMRERARDIDATLSITSQPDQGTEVLVAWQEMEMVP